MAKDTRGIIVKSDLTSPPIQDVDLYSSIAGAFHKYSDKTALTSWPDGDSLTYAEYKEQIERLAGYLVQHGFRQGSVLAVLSPNSLAYAICAMAAFRLGGAVAGFHAQLSSDEVKRQLNFIDAHFLFVGKGLTSVAIQATCELNMKLVISQDPAPEFLQFSSIMHKMTPLPPLPVIDQLGINTKEATALIIFSSGTTGSPKAIRITHYNCLTNLNTLNHPKFATPSDVTIVYQPMSQIFGFDLMVQTASMGGNMVIMSCFKLQTYLQAVQIFKIPVVHLVPPVALALAKSPEVNGYDLSSVKVIECACAPLSAELEMEVMARLGNAVHIRQVYGLTETTGIVTFGLLPTVGNPDPPPGNVGILTPFTEAKVISLDTGESLPADMTGELYVRGPQVMKEYVNDKEATEAAIDDDGWLRTGDLAKYDQNGFFFVLDRIKELMNVNGYRVAPAEIESIILCHPQVADVGVVGIPNEGVGELPFAWVVTKPRCTMSEGDIIDFVNSRTSPAKHLCGGVRFVDSIPKSASGKILRRVMREEASV